MAKRIIEHMTDDLDGSDADRTVEFSYQGTTYSLDLNNKNAGELEEALAPYIAAAEKAGSVQGGRGASRSSRLSTPRQRSTSDSADLDSKAVRAWAESNGVEVSPRGRISAKVIEQYRTANA